MDAFKKMGKNWSKNTKSKALGDTGKKTAYTLLGGFLYTIIPTAIQGWGGVDMSGAKGIIAGSVGSSIIGIVSDKKEITTGGLATAGIHLVYAHLNGTITSIFNTPIFAASTGAITTTTDTETIAMNDGVLPSGYGFNSRGEIVALNTPSNQMTMEQAQPVSSFTGDLRDRYTSQLNDYTDKLQAAAPFSNNFMTNDLKTYGLAL